MSRPQSLLLPVRPWFIAFSLLLALFLNLLPWRNTGWMLMPDFVALVLLYWNLHEAERISIGWGFVFGLMMDAADTSLSGQHALAYVVMLYASHYLIRRLRRFGRWAQAAHIWVLLLLSAVIMTLIRLLAGDSVPNLSYFAAPLLGGLMWPIVSVLLQIPQRRRIEHKL